MPLFELADLAAYLQRDLDTASASVARDAAEGVVRGYTGQHLEHREHVHRLTPRPQRRGWAVTLPQRPVTEVTAVAVDGSALPASAWWWGGVGSQVRVDLPAHAASTAHHLGEVLVDVTYTAGYDPVPGDVRAVALAVAARVYDNPRGLRAESIDDYSATRAGGDDDLAGVGLLAPERLILDRYRSRVGTVTVSS